MTRAEWLASLKVGDSVGILHEGHAYDTGTITKITPSGRITVADRYTFTADGAQYPKPERFARRYVINPVDDDFTARAAWKQNEVRRVALTNQIHAFVNANAPKGFDHATHNAALQAALDALRSKL